MSASPWVVLSVSATSSGLPPMYAAAALLHADRKRVLLRLVPQERVEAHAVLDRRKGLGVEHAAKALDRVAHRLRVGDDVELRKVHPVRREVELGAHRGPV